MKTFCFLAWLILLIGCEIGEKEVREAPDARKYATMSSEQLPTLVPTSSVCESHLDMIGTLDLSGEMLSSEHEIAVPKGAHGIAYYLSALPYSRDGDEMIDEELVWGMANKKLGIIVSHAWNNSTVEVKVTRDYFDLGDKEPESVAGVCVQDPCNTFEPIVYPRPSCTKFRVVGLLNLQGVWRVISSTSPMAIEVNVYQKGRALKLTHDANEQQNALLQDNTVTLDVGAHRYECSLTSRTHCEGIITNIQTDEMVGTWTADRL